MDEKEFLDKLREVTKLMEDYKGGKLKKSTYNWDKEINETTKTLSEKYHMVNSGGSKCPSCNGSGRL